MSFTHIRYILASDIFLACLFPLLVFIIGYQHFRSASLADIRALLSLHSRKSPGSNYFSLERAYHSFDRYAQLSANELARMRASYAKLGRVGKNVGYRIGYPKKLDRLRDVTELNATITAGVVEVALQDFPTLNNVGRSETASADLGRVREALKHFVRDWSSEGIEERTRIFAPILKVLEAVPEANRKTTKVLVPGCGLGRLAWEISQLGFDTTANELSFFMTLALRFLFSPKTTDSVNQHTLRPYAHWFSHQRSNESLFRSISFPDVVPRFDPNFHLLEGDFLKIPVSPEGLNYIVTLFFIDTSIDVFATMTHIYNLLKPGGVWLNLGPLLWTAGGQAKAELNLEEILAAAEDIGFVVDTGLSQTIECEYTGDKNAMMRWIYKAEFWVAKKSK